MKNVMLGVLVAVLSSVGFAQSNVPTKRFNVDYMVRGYFYAGSKIVDKDALGGFGGSKNLSKPIDGTFTFTSNEISIIAMPDSEVAFADKYRGMRVVLVNGTDEPVGFPASDSRLYIVQEAMDKTGTWKPVEYLPSSWCGNSYHRVFLGSNEYWDFAAAKLNGSFKTKLRFRLQVEPGKDKSPIYSNEFDGSVNLKQFTHQEGHQPGVVMDPYNN